jgi:hypothetical protein
MGTSRKRCGGKSPEAGNAKNATTPPSGHILFVILNRQANIVGAEMWKECFVDGGPHENRFVILSVLGLSHPLDVPKYDA